jgi:hypothetical protein
VASRWLSPLLELTASSDRSVSALSSTGCLSPDPCPSEPTASSGSLPISLSTPWAAQQLSLLRSPKPYHTPHLDHQRLPKPPPEGPACKERHHPSNRRPITCLRAFTPSSQRHRRDHSLLDGLPTPACARHTPPPQPDSNLASATPRHSLLFFLFPGRGHEEIERVTRSMTCLKAPSLDRADRRDANQLRNSATAKRSDQMGRQRWTVTKIHHRWRE